MDFALAAKRTYKNAIINFQRFSSGVTMRNDVGESAEGGGRPFLRNGNNKHETPRAMTLNRSEQRKVE